MAEFAQKNTNAIMTFDEVNDLVNGRIVTNAQVNLAELAFAEWLAAEDAALQSEYQTYRNYYLGEHKYQLTDRMLEFLELDSNIKFDLNYIPIPVDVLNERLEVDFFEVAGEDENTPDDRRQGGSEGIFAGWLKLNRFPSLQDDTHHYMLRDGDAFVIAEWDSDRGVPILYANEGDDGTTGVYVAYHEQDNKRLKFAVKRWRIETGNMKGNMRLNVYTDDAVYKYVTGASGYVPFVENEGDDWPIPWINPKTGQPIKLTVIHFDGKKSQIADIIPAQDALNKSVIDELAGADIEGFSLITLSGGESPVDESGNSTVDIGPRRIIWAKEGSWGSISAGDLSGLSMIVDKYIQRMAQMSRIPLAYYQITGQVASAETQKADDTGLVSKVERIAKYTGGYWEDVMDACRRLHNAFGDGEPLDEEMITVVWKSFERVDKRVTERTEAETAVLKQQTFAGLLMDNVPRELAAKLAGYDDETAAAMAKMERPFLDGSITQSGIPGADTAENIQGKGLTGIAGKNSVETLQQLAAGQITKLTAVEILVGYGFTRDVAEKMAAAEVDNQMAAKAIDTADIASITQ